MNAAGPRGRRRGGRPASENPYQAESNGFQVRVRPSYLPEQSDPEEHRFVWAYRVEIENRGEETAQLISRHWIITDASGRVEEVQGLGVVGEQPSIRPGETYAYASGCPLATTSGVMAGTYAMVSDGGSQFEIEIPAFSLDVPTMRRVVN
jgi:ApaG protein